ncbi:hypothetical protein GOODEAATRI_030702 [Goodea atripinnis]|uniref:Uncharacterized protein n=1 Tax=Goodea atripinnis TaxID=208336 RepID=A0ABV0PIH6_9TELE
MLMTTLHFLLQKLVISYFNLSLALICFSSRAFLLKLCQSHFFCHVSLPFLSKPSHAPFSTLLPLSPLLILFDVHASLIFTPFRHAHTPLQSHSATEHILGYIYKSIKGHLKVK